MRWQVSVLFFFLFSSLVNLLSAGEVKVNIGTKTKVKVVDGEIVIYGDGKGPRVAYPKSRLSAYKVGNYSVREIESRNDVREALKVYKSKGSKIREKKVLIYDKETGKRTLITAYSYDDGKSYYILPNGEVIYVDLRDGVPCLLYQNLNIDQERPIFYGLNYWNFLPCGNSVVVVVEDDEGRKYLLWSGQEFRPVSEGFVSSCKGGEK